MDQAKLFIDVHDFAVALNYASPRTLAMMSVLPIFNSAIVPGMLRLGIGAAIAAFTVPALLPGVHIDFTSMQLIMLVVKEAFIGFALGYAMSIPFWAFEAVGFLIDNQRGASIAATLNPLTGNDSSPMGILFNQAFIVFFFICGGFQLVLGLLYDSYRLWPVYDFTPTLRPETIPLVLGQLDHMMRLTMLYAAPVVIAMFLAELGLALVSRFVPQLQVFFLAMPIKSALALFVLIIYGATLFEEARHSIDELAKIVPSMQREWSPR